MAITAGNPFPPYTQMRTRVPLRVWHAGRVASLLGALGVCALLVAEPKTGLKVWWGLLVPLLPLLWFTVPGLWRNLCPLAASNQTPRLLGFTRGLTAPGWFREYAPTIGIVAFMLAVASRPVLFNTSGPATAALIASALIGAFAGGVTFKGKSGWCSSICPLLPVQRVYGQVPLVTVPNSHCQPCVGCTRNCYDFNPRVAYLADLHADERHFTGPRLFFVAAFPGVVLAYFTTPSDLGTLDQYARFAGLVGASAGSFFLAQAVVHVSLPKLTSLYGAAAFNLFYWWASMVLAGTLLGDRHAPAIWLLRALALGLTVQWLVRGWRKERVYDEVVAEPVAAATDENASLGGGALAAIRQAQAGRPEVVIEPAGLRVLAKPGQTLLEVAEGSDQKLEAGCRMGVCGADPICIVAGAEHLSAPTADERATLERLGFADTTRMACCAKVRGPVTMRLTPERAESAAVARVEGFAFDPEVQRVVVIGNGIAGLTAADHVRRRHPDCTIDVVADEPYPLYNRMGIARLIYGRSAMVGLHLLPDAWYDENRVTTWLNTRAIAIDREKRVVRLGTWESLEYDRLVLATGSDAFLPDIPGWELTGTCVLRRAEDALSIREYVQRLGVGSAAVAGGGLLGLEAAFALSKLGLKVTVLERGEWLLRRQLDLRAAQLLTAYLQGLGLNIMLRAQTASLEGDGRVERVLLEDGTVVEAGVFLVAAGIAPAVALARAAGLEVGRGVVVDDAMRTTDPAVFAVGDVAEHRGRILGLWPAGVEQAEVAAENAVGGERTYGGTVPVTMLKVVGIDLLSCGRFEARDDADELIVAEEPERHAYSKLLVRDGRLEGAILLGHPTSGAAVSAAVRESRDVTGILDALRAGDLELLGG